MKKIFVLIAVLTAMLLTVGMAQAIVIEGNGTASSNIMGNGSQGAVKIYGVFDDAPGMEVVVPFICGKDADNGLNTLFSVGETSATNRHERRTVVTLHRFVNNVRSAHVFDDTITLTGYDIFSDDCKTLVSRMSTAQRAMVEKTIAGKTYYAGYILFKNETPVVAPTDNPNYVKKDNLISWVYLVDLTKGFAAGMNGLNFQGGCVGNLCERTPAGAAVCSTVSWMYPRFFVLNDSADTFNWWLILSGRNQIETPTVRETRQLGGPTGVFCDENENCISLQIPIPDEFNIINVREHIPAGLFRAYPYAGFALLPYASNQVAYDANTTYVGWSYQRAADTAGASLSWSVIHPIHKDY